MKERKVLTVISDVNSTILLTNSELVRFDNENQKEIFRKKIPSRIVLYSGGLSPRFLIHKNHLFASYYSTEDIELNMTSKEFVKKASFLKIYNKETFELVKKIPFPKTIIYEQGIFQPTRYEPLISIDKINNELEILFPIDPFIYVYDLSSFSFLRKVEIPGLNIMAKPLPFGKTEKLKSNFDRDHKKASLIKILNLNGNTLIGIRPSKLNLEGNNYLEYIFLDNLGVKKSSLKLRKTDKYTWIIGKKS